VTREPFQRGHVLVESDFDAKRPGTGVGPQEMRYVLGRRLAVDVQADHVVRWVDLE
jgi:N-acetylneuraminate synthase